MIKDYLVKLQELQRDTLDSYVNISIETHYDPSNDEPWLSITVTLEGWTSKIMKPVPVDEKYLSVQMYGLPGSTEAERENRLAAVYKDVETFVKAKLAAYED